MAFFLADWRPQSSSKGYFFVRPSQTWRRPPKSSEDFFFLFGLYFSGGLEDLKVKQRRIISCLLGIHFAWAPRPGHFHFCEGRMASFGEAFGQLIGLLCGTGSPPMSGGLAGWWLLFPNVSANLTAPAPNQVSISWSLLKSPSPFRALDRFTS